MNQETTLMAPETVPVSDRSKGDFNPINLGDAAKWVAAFREVRGNKDGYGVIHRPDCLLEYLQKDFPRIVKQQEAHMPKPEGFDWGVGHFFMRPAKDETEFCVAPILFRVDDSDPQHPRTLVYDPFDRECPYDYTYGISNIHGTAADDNGDVYDMGEMWP